MNFATLRMIVAMAPVVGLGLSACTVMTKEEHLALHEEIRKDIVTSDEHNAMMQEMMKGAMMEMMKKERMK